MYHKLKKSQIIDWWIAPENSVMRFTNILSGENPILENFLVVGYLDKEKRQLATSTNRVVRITDNGVMTAQGTFYPFEEAHELYLQFLIKVNQPNTVFAFKWEYVQRQMLIADVVEKGNVIKGVEFDFIPDSETSAMLFGYSKTLSANVVLSTFDKRNVCIRIAIPDSVEHDIYYGSFAVSEESMERLEKVKEIFSKNIDKKYTCVMQIG